MQLLKWLLNHLLFAGTMFFAAGASAIADQGGAYDGALDGGDGGDGSNTEVHDDAGDLDNTSEISEGDQADADANADEAAKTAAAQNAQTRKINEDPDAKEFTSQVSGRIRNMVKAAPELTAIFKAHPEIQNSIEAGFRERAAYKEVFPTIAEARQMRDQFPNGIADVQALQSDVKEVEQLDTHFYTQDQNGNYPGHSEIIGNMFTDDPAAAAAFMRTVPKEWHRRDPDSYNEVMGQIVGATLNGRQWQARLQEIREFVAAGGDAAAMKQASTAIDKIEREMLGYSQGKAKPTEAEEHLAEREKKFKTDTAQQQKQEQGRFHQTFLGESRKLQVATIAAHPAITRLQNLVKTKAMTQEKYDKIVGEIRLKVEQFLGKSPSFMRKLKPAHASRNLEETLNLQKAAWSQQWLLNRMVRSVLQVETPGMVQANRGSQRRAATQQSQSRQSGDKNQNRTEVRTKNYQENGRWYRPNGSPFTTGEVLAGKHLL